MFVLRYFAIASVFYLVLAIAIPAAIGAYYGAILWRKIYLLLQHRPQGNGGRMVPDRFGTVSTQ